MRAQIITIGDEIVIGQIVDTNSAFICDRLNGMGVRVVSVLSIRDNESDIREAAEWAMSSSDITILTGGLGPTKDDITKKCLAQVFNCGMRRDEQTYDMVERMLGERGVNFNALNQGQAMVPQCCTVLPNRNGTAPGMWFERDDAVLVSLPGVPFEMKALMDNEVLHRLTERFKLSAILHKTIMTIGIAESELAATIEGWEIALPHYLRLAYLPGTSGIRLRLSAYEVNGESVEAEIEAQFAKLRQIIPNYILSEGCDSVEADLAHMLTVRGQTLGVAESCTGGAISGRFTAMAGASDYFLCGVVSYSNDAKVEVLGVNPDDIERYGAVSGEVAQQMAQGVRRISGSDWGVATTGIAGPSGGTPEKPVGTVWIAVAHSGGVVSRKMSFGNLREQNIERASSNAINLLRVVMRSTAN